MASAWAAGDEVRGLARHWALVYGHLARLVAADAGVRQAALVVRFEELCAAPAATLRAVLDHCGLPDVEGVLWRGAPGVRAPIYYDNNFSDRDLDVIREEAGNTARLRGY